MTSQSPRIYTYKITFEEVPYYYYGMHEEKVYAEEYWGSPVTHKWCWELYTPKKQILETFSSREDAGEVERRLIKPVYNTDKWCLNANCGGIISSEVHRKTGKKMYEKRKGFHAFTKKQRYNNSSKGGKIAKQLGKGIFALTPEQRNEHNKKLKEQGKGIHSFTFDQRSEYGKKAYKLGVGVHGRTKEEMIEQGSKNGKKLYEQGKGIFARTKEEMTEHGKVGGKLVSLQKWQCTVTKHISSAASLARYQKARGIDTSNRIRIE
jgi:hypothetical protein